MGRRSRREPAWPLALMVAVVAGGLGVGTFMTGGLGSERSGSALEAGLAGTGSRIPAPGDRIRVEVLNAGGVQGAASAVKDVLRDEGFDVVYYGNAPSFGRDTTLVLARTGGEDAAAAVARSLGAGRVSFEPDPTLLVDVTVLVGTDWPGVETAREGAGSPGSSGPGAAPRTGAADARGLGGAVAGKRAWWDPRRLLDGLNGAR